MNKTTNRSNFVIQEKTVVAWSGDALDARVPYGVTHVGPNAFKNCKKLARVRLPSTVVSVDSGAFYGCDSL